MRFILLVLLVCLSTAIARAEIRFRMPNIGRQMPAIGRQVQAPKIIVPISTPNVTPAEEVKPTTLSRRTTASEDSPVTYKLS